MIAVLQQARGSRDFSGLILDEQQKDRELAKLRREASDLDDKVPECTLRIESCSCEINKDLGDLHEHALSYDVVLLSLR